MRIKYPKKKYPSFFIFIFLNGSYLSLCVHADLFQYTKDSELFCIQRAPPGSGFCVRSQVWTYAHTRNGSYSAAKMIYLEHHKTGIALVLNFHNKWTGSDAVVTQRKILARYLFCFYQTEFLENSQWLQHLQTKVYYRPKSYSGLVCLFCFFP